MQIPLLPAASTYLASTSSPGKKIEEIYPHLAEIAGEDFDGLLKPLEPAVMGSAAEIAPTPLLLATGADVLWIDVAPPPAAWLTDETLSGRITRGAGIGDLLAQPRETAAAIAEYAAAGPVDCGLFAYAGGGGREWRLGSAMNAIVDAVGPERVRSVALYVSPTHPATLSRPDSAVVSAKRPIR